MTKRKGIFDVNVNLDVNTLSIPKNKRKKDNGITIEQALQIILRQMDVSGARPRTLYDYEYTIDKFVTTTNAVYLLDITNNLIYQWLESMNVTNQTKLTRLKCFKAFLGRCFDNGWLENKFWRNINVKVDQKIKEGATDKDVNMLLSVLDFNNFLDLRNGTAVLLMYKTGISIATLSKLEECHIDLENKLLVLDGKLMKNHKGLKLPIDDQLAYLLNILMEQNEKIRKEYRQFNEYVFITNKGEFVSKGITSNAIQKQLNKYSRRYGIKNISPHSLRRGFATNLLRKGANINLISKALSHSDLGVTTQYLSIDIKTGTDSGVKTSVTVALKIASERGLLKTIPPGTPPAIIANVATIAIENVKILNRVAIGEMSVTQGLQQMERVTVATTAGLISAEIGAVNGAVLGALALSWIPLVGSPAGAFLGGVIGGTVGYMAGSSVGRKVCETAQKVRRTVTNTIKAGARAVKTGFNKAKNFVKSLF